VNLGQLTESLSGNDPSPPAVMALVERKRRAARRRVYAASAGLAVVVAVAAVAGGVLLAGKPASTVAGFAPAAAPAVPHAGRPSATPGAEAMPGTAPRASEDASCPAGSLRNQLTAAVHDGASLIIGYGTASGASGSPAGAYSPLTLRSVQTLAGPPVRSGSTAWAREATAGGQSLPAAGSEIFAIATPTATSTGTVAVLRLASVVNGQVIFSADGCWNVTGVPASPARSGYAVPLAAVEELASAAARG
jgi:hypothetical protein